MGRWRRNVAGLVVLFLLAGSTPAAADFLPIQPPVPVPGPVRLLAEVNLTSPADGTLLPAREEVEVTWTASGSMAGFRLQYEWEVLGGYRTTVASCIAASARSYRWRVPAGAGQIRLHLTALNTCSGTSLILGSDTSAWYTVPLPEVTLVQPNGGGEYVAGGSYPISWRMAPWASSHVSISYSPDNGATWSPVVTNLVNGGQYTWDVPEDLAPTTQGRIKVQAMVTYPGTEFPVAASSATSGPFSVRRAGLAGVVLLAPDPPRPGELVFTPGETARISWRAQHVASVGYWYSTDFGAGWEYIGCRHPSWNGDDWVVPGVETETARVRISGFTGTLCTGLLVSTDISTHPFAIRSTTGNRAPRVTAAETLAPEPGGIGTVAVLATDPDGDEMDFHWAQVEGPPAHISSGINTRRLEYWAPSSAVPYDLVWEVTVSDAPTRGAAALSTRVRIYHRVMPRPARVEDITKTCGGIGTRLSITGSGLRGAQVYFNGRLARNDTRGMTEFDQNFRILTYVPAGATSGPVVVRDTAGREVVAADSFTVVPAVVDHVVVTQGIREYPLVWGKETLVQVFPRSARLAACRAEISSGTISIDGASTGGAIRGQAGTGGVVLQPLPVRIRSLVSEAVNFRIPADRLQFNPADFRGFAIYLTHNQEVVTTLTLDRASLPPVHDVTGGIRVLMVRMSNRSMGVHPDYLADKLAGQQAFLRAMPVPGAWSSVFPADGRFVLYTDEQITARSGDFRRYTPLLEEFRQAWNDRRGVYAHKVAGIIDLNSFGGGSAIGRAWMDGNQSVNVNGGGFGFTLGQEVGHNYGLVASGATNHDAGNAGHSRYDEGEDCDQTLTFGQSLVDQLGHSSYVVNTSTITQLASAPTSPCADQAKSIMSYVGGGNNANSFFEYIDYLHLFGRAGGTTAAGAGAGVSMAASGSLKDPGDNPPKPELVIHGFLTHDGQVTISASRLAPAGAADQPDNNGHYQLAFLDDQGALLGSHPFAVTFHEEHHPNDPPADHSVAPFSVRTPFPPGTRAVEIHGQGQLLHRLKVSAAAPEVKILSPQPQGQVQPNGTIDLKWSATDPDGDSLQYLVRWSPDGQNWMPVAVMLSNPELPVPAGDLPGGQGWLRVDASDGFNVGTAVVGPLDIPDKPPQVVISRPGDKAVYYLGQPVFLSARAYDLEDGYLEDKQLLWSSSLDGALGAGTELSLPELSPGQHEIKVTATDSAGQPASATVNLYVSAEEMPAYTPEVKGGEEPEPKP